MSGFPLFDNIFKVHWPRWGSIHLQLEPKPLIQRVHWCCKASYFICLLQLCLVGIYMGPSPGKVRSLVVWVSLKLRLDCVYSWCASSTAHIGLPIQWVCWKFRTFSAIKARSRRWQDRVCQSCNLMAIRDFIFYLVSFECDLSVGWSFMLVDVLGLICTLGNWLHLFQLISKGTLRTSKPDNLFQAWVIVSVLILDCSCVRVVHLAFRYYCCWHSFLCFGL